MKLNYNKPAKWHFHSLNKYLLTWDQTLGPGATEIITTEISKR